MRKRRTFSGKSDDSATSRSVEKLNACNILLMIYTTHNNINYQLAFTKLTSIY